MTRNVLFAEGHDICILVINQSKSFPIYHVNNKLLEQGSKFRLILQKFIQETLIDEKLPGP